MDNVKFVQSLYSAFSRGDMETIYEGCDPNIDWWSNVDPALVPWGGGRRGIDGVKSFFAEIAAHVDFETFEPQQFLNGQGFVLVLGHTIARMKPAGGRIDDEWAHCLWIRGGKVVQFREFSDTHAVIQAYHGADAHAVAASAATTQPRLHH